MTEPRRSAVKKPGVGRKKSKSPARAEPPPTVSFGDGIITDADIDEYGVSHHPGKFNECDLLPPSAASSMKADELVDVVLSDERRKYREELDDLIREYNELWICHPDLARHRNRVLVGSNTDVGWLAEEIRQLKNLASGPGEDIMLDMAWGMFCKGMDKVIYKNVYLKKLGGLEPSRDNPEPRSYGYTLCREEVKEQVFPLIKSLMSKYGVKSIITLVQGPELNLALVTAGTIWMTYQFNTDPEMRAKILALEDQVKRSFKGGDARSK